MAKISVNQKLSKAKSLMKKGETDSAREIYLEILSAYPQNKIAREELTAITNFAAQNTQQGPPAEVTNNIVSLYNKKLFTKVFE